MLVKIVNLILSCECHIACECDNLHAGGTHKESHIETYLVVAGTGGAVGNGIGANLVGIACNGKCLKYALR